jgi:hypothetical protein
MSTIAVHSKRFDLLSPATRSPLLHLGIRITIKLDVVLRTISQLVPTAIQDGPVLKFGSHRVRVVRDRRRWKIFQFRRDDSSFLRAHR